MGGRLTSGEDERAEVLHWRIVRPRGLLGLGINCLEILTPKCCSY
jgi:hypothetical protein